VSEIEMKPDAMRCFDIGAPDGNEMRWYQLLTSETHVTRERHQP
jgi:hypothetical protein